MSIAGVDEPAVDRLPSGQRRNRGACAHECDDWEYGRARYTIEPESRSRGRV